MRGVGKIANIFSRMQKVALIKIKKGLKNEQHNC